MGTMGAKKAAETASRRFLKERIFLTRRTLGSARTEHDTLKSEIKSSMVPPHSDEVLKVNEDIYRDVFTKCKSRQQTKFDKLVQPKSSRTVTSLANEEKWVVNLSSRTITASEQQILQKGLGFAVSPRRIPATEIIAQVETAVKKLDTVSADAARRDVDSILQKARPPKHNISKEMNTALKSLKADDSITILPADKGRSTVILDSTTYHEKLTDLLESGPYRELKKDPTDRLCRKLSSTLLNLKKDNVLDEPTYRRLKPTQKQPPRIYGLPKIHKPTVPLRPIVSCIGSFAYNLSKHLAEILSPLTGSTEHAIPNSSGFAEFIAEQTIGPQESMVSFDVVSLFTNVPIEGACSAALQRLQSDSNLSTRTSLSPEQLTQLLEFVLRSTYFLYKGSYYEQTEGAAMGSPVSAVVANLYMESFEEEALDTCPLSSIPRVWKRYVDDTFIIVASSQTDNLLKHMNSRQPSIQFTSEVECDGKIAFLDTLVHRHENHRLSTSVYRKPTHTDQYIAFDSHHPTSVKRGLVKCLFDRASRIVTSPQQPSKERTRVRNALSLNGYPRRFVQNTKKNESEPRDPKVYKSFVVLPYIDGVSPQLRRRLESHGIRTVFRSDTTLRQQLTRPKDPIPQHRRDGVVYNIPCKGCNRSYIGETARPISERITEHKRDVRLRRTDSSAVAEHAWENQHQPDWDGVQCISQERHWYTRRVKEAINIRLKPDNFNRDNGIDIPEFWIRTIRRHDTPR